MGMAISITTIAPFSGKGAGIDMSHYWSSLATHNVPPSCDVLSTGPSSLETASNCRRTPVSPAGQSCQSRITWELHAMGIAGVWGVWVGLLHAGVNCTFQPKKLWESLAGAPVAASTGSSSAPCGIFATSRHNNNGSAWRQEKSEKHGRFLGEWMCSQCSGSMSFDFAPIF